jgi:hypothetical protein
MTVLERISRPTHIDGKSVEVQPPDSYAFSMDSILFIIGLDYGLFTGDPNTRPIALDIDKTFCNPSLRGILQTWIFVLCLNGYDQDVHGVAFILVY